MVSRRRRPTPEQQIAIENIRAVERQITDYFQSLALGMARSVRFHSDPLTDADRQAILRDIDRALGPAFGSSRQYVKDGELYRIITQAMEQTAEDVYRHSLNRTKALIDRRDPDLWPRMRSRILLGPEPKEDDWQFIVRMFESPEAQRSRFLRSKLLDPERKWVPKDRWTTKRGNRLSDRLWLQKRQVRNQIDQVLRDGIAQGRDPIRMAKELETFLVEGAMPKVLMTPDGREIRKNLTQAPRNGWGSYPARRLAITEVQRINAAATLQVSEATPGVIGVKWVLSNNHPMMDRCDERARGHSEGMPAGVYRTGEAPLLPDHPNCRCTYLSAFDHTDAWIDELVSSVMGEAA